VDKKQRSAASLRKCCGPGFEIFYKRYKRQEKENKKQRIVSSRNPYDGINILRMNRKNSRRKKSEGFVKKSFSAEKVSAKKKIYYETG
jgi:hypothetical protein